jgi:hypothetical protein
LRTPAWRHLGGLFHDHDRADVATRGRSAHQPARPLDVVDYAHRHGAGRHLDQHVAGAREQVSGDSSVTSKSSSCCIGGKRPATRVPPFAVRGCRLLWMRYALLGALVCSLFASATAHAAVVPADPTNFKAKFATLKPGDTLKLAAGDYDGGLSIHGVSGAPGKPITIEGPASGAPARLLAKSCCNTLDLQDAAYIVIKNLTFDGQDISGVDAVKANGGAGHWTHDITVEGCTITHHDGGGTSQQTVGVSTKIVSWNWIIRDNVIDGAGTGMYLGNSDGTEAFIGGLIEGNLYRHTLGYNMEIKQQIDRQQSDVPQVPTDVRTTIIRNNVFLKENNPSPDGARPNLLVDGFPDSGPGSQDHYEIYGNFFFHNDDDALLQATGRVHVHDNLFVDSKHAGVHFMDHAGKTVIDAIAYNNTVYGTAQGVSFGAAPSGVSLVAGNAIFAATPLSGTMTNEHDDITDSVANAGNYVVNPGLTLGQMDFFPKSGSALHGSQIDLSSVKSDTDYDRDFNGTQKDFTYRGAYQGEGTNPGWKPQNGLKSGGASGGAGGSGAGGSGAGGSGAGGTAGGPATGGSAAGGAAAGGASSGGASSGGPSSGAASGDSGGCGCRAAGSRDGTPLWALLGLLALGVGARGRRGKPCC